ncbi:Fungal specific transcription factor domain [Geosmithia morbida]|uniref:Fungal specific transcription factor domain n=1 Tax=Geosmithia morbida TaxID=1094350 RepID=A0A9P4YS16_9HYPO|nr:Fungal specific transcription factor domain [Geosmithia morbida]KAF4119954.1 Fungal specific transcription factor domain [Geosmithia morbida]
MDDDSGQTPSVHNPSSGTTPQGASTNSGTPSQSHLTPSATGASSTASQPSGQGGSSASQSSKRKRGLGIVTPNACTECRKKRAKVCYFLFVICFSVTLPMCTAFCQRSTLTYTLLQCDGRKPCGRCQAQREADCVYETPIRQSKEHLRTEIESLRHRQRSSDTVISALVRPQLWEEVLNRLRGGESVESISEWLGGPVSPQAVGSGSSSGPLPVPIRQMTGVRPESCTTPLPDFTRPTTITLTANNLGVGGLPGVVATERQLQQPPSIRGSPWATSNHNGSYTEPMSWTLDVPGGGAAPPEVVHWGDHDRRQSLPATMPRFHGLKQILSPWDEPDIMSTQTTWTNLTNDINLVQHLLALYFCWEYPTFASLSKEHFLRDFQDGRPRFCSTILVNALLALGCRFSTKPMTRANPNDPYSSGDHFFKECQRLFYQETDHHSLTTIQALGIMSIREASCGRDSESWYYAGQSIRLAIEMGLHRISDEGDEDELAVQSATFWGAFALDHAWSLATGSLPQCSCFPHLPPKSAIIDDIEASLWVPYTDDGETSFRQPLKALLANNSSAGTGASLLERCEQPSNVRSVYKCFCELSELVHQSLYILHSPGRPLTARDMLGIYTQYLNWYDRIPEVLRLGHNFTPAVLFAHMYYHFAILLLFRPLIKLRISGSTVTPRDVCCQAADAIQGLLRSYSQLYTLRRTPSFVPYFVLTSAIMHLAIGAVSDPDTVPGSSTTEKMESAAKMDPKVSASLRQGISDLTEMAPCHQFAEQALNILRYIAKKWNIDVKIYESDPPTDYDRLVKPYTSSLNFFAPDVREEDFLRDWGNRPPPTEDSVGDGTSTSLPKAADNLGNPLCWPFPMQGRPILPIGKELEQAGFAPL